MFIMKNKGKLKITNLAAKLRHCFQEMEYENKIYFILALLVLLLILL